MATRPEHIVTHAVRAALLVALIAALVFWRTAYPTITWWDSSSYSLAAATLGITSSPGSLLLTLLGWLVTRVPTGGSPAHALNLLAGALAAITAALVCLLARRLLRVVAGGAAGGAATVGAALGALAFAFGATVWEHAVMFTPYILTALFTALILWVMVRWWEEADRADAWRWIALLGLLFGLDFSVHRSNALLVPGAVAWILARHPRTLQRRAAWLAGIGGLMAGLAVQLLVMPIAAHTHSMLVMLEPTTWSRFWDYVSLAQVGGGFLVDLWPRKAPFWSVQVADLLRVVRDAYLHWSTPVRVLGILPGLAALLGFTALWRRDRRLAMALLVVLLLQASMTVLYFNIPANYFRSLDRHYLPVLVTLGVAVALGTGVAARWVAAPGRRPLAVGAGVCALAVVPAAQLVGNWRTHDAARRWFARDYAANALATLPPRAIYFTVGDNDTFPLWYLQAVEGVRPDVRVVNLSLANAAWYVRQLARRDPSFPVHAPAASDIPVRPLPHPPTGTVVIPVRRTPAQLGLPDGVAVPDAITVTPAPRVGTDYLPADDVLLDIVRTNAWRDPLCISATAGPEGMGWLQPYARPAGLHACVVPVAGLGPDRDALRRDLLARFRYRGYADSTLALDETSRNIGVLYLESLGTLLDAEHAAPDVCRDDARRVLAAVPPERLAPAGRSRAELEARCRG